MRQVPSAAFLAAITGPRDLRLDEGTLAPEKLQILILPNNEKSSSKELLLA